MRCENHKSYENLNAGMTSNLNIQIKAISRPQSSKAPKRLNVSKLKSEEVAQQPDTKLANVHVNSGSVKEDWSTFMDTVYVAAI
jgi:hypothetical protein